MKAVTDTVGISDFLLLRFLAAALPLTAFGLVRSRRLTAAELRVGMLYGALLFAVLYLETLGVHLSSAANGGFLIAVSVVVIPVIDRFVFRTAMSLLVVPFVVLALAGTALTTLSGGWHLASGDALILAAAMLRAGQTVLYAHQRHAATASTMNITVVQMWTVAVLAFAAGGFDANRVLTAVAAQSATALALIVYLGVVCTAAAFLAQLWVGPKLPAVTVGLLLATEPLFAGISAVALGGETLGAAQMAGGALIVVAAVGGRYVSHRG